MNHPQEAGLKIAVLGARRARQGTGYYIARAFAQQSCTIQAIVGTHADSIDDALAMLRAEDIHPNAYLNSRELFENEDIDIVVIATPVQFHLQYIEESLQHGCHIFCEKPLFLPDTEMSAQEVYNKTEALVVSAHTQGSYLHLNTQWPHTLSAFRSLYPGIDLEKGAIQSFAMELSPQSTEVEMLIDAAPHLLSMLYALVGTGTLKDCRITLNPKDACIEFIYQHQQGECEVQLMLQWHLQQPKPAAYAINGHRIERHINMEDYSLSFSKQQHSVACDDPLKSSVQQCLKRVRSGESMRQELLDGMQHLQQLLLVAHG